MPRAAVRLSDYDAFLHEKRGQCQICGRSFSKCNLVKVIDHCHRSGSFRGTLCRNCNMGIGLFAESIEALIAAAFYLDPDAAHEVFRELRG
jgi:Recombination endonuclease VII